ncbi:MAG: enoyl-CoA hydratase/isomerase family protein [Flavobacteriaceae bacterium]
MEQAYVTLHIENKIGYIEFYHPQHNAMPGGLLQELEAKINQAAKNTSIAVIVLKSGGNRTFCAGASFNELLSIKTEAEGEAFFLGFAKVINAMRNCQKPIIGRIQGKAVGGGVGLAAATDYCLATQHASIKLSELSIGIGPFVIEPAVSRKIGLSATAQLTFDAETFYSAQWAKEKGFYYEIFENTEALDQAVSTLATRLSTYSPEALKQIKTAFWENTKHWDKLLAERAKISGKLVLQPEVRKTLNAFKK